MSKRISLSPADLAKVAKLDKKALYFAWFSSLTKQSEWVSKHDIIIPNPNTDAFIHKRPPTPKRSQFPDRAHWLAVRLEYDAIYSLYLGRIINAVKILDIETRPHFLDGRPVRTGRILAECLSCGSVFHIRSCRLRVSNPARSIKDCGCGGERRGRPTLDAPGAQYGSLTLIRRLPGIAHKGKWECLCSCGELTLLTRQELIRGKRCPAC